MVIKRPSIPYQALVALFAALMILSLIASLSDFWKLDLPMSALLLYTGAATAFGWICWRAPWFSSAVAVAGLAVLTASSRFVPTWARFVMVVATQASEFAASVQQHQLEASFGPALGALFLVAVAAGAALLIMREALVRGSTFWSIAAGAIIFGTQWTWYYDKSAGYFMTYAVLAFALWILSQAARREATWEATSRKIGYRSHVATPLAWILVVALLAAMLPNNFDPIDLGALGERAQSVFPLLKQMRGSGVGAAGGRFSLATTGFSPTLGLLGGPVKLDQSVALHLTADKPLKSTAYLRGATFLTYTGRSWQTHAAAYTKVPPESTLPSSLDATVLRENMTVKLTPAANLGNTLFGMLEPMRVDGLKSDYRADPDGNLWSEKAVPKGTGYQLTARVPTYSAQQIRTLSTTTPGDTYKPYLQISETFTRRVANLNREISQGQVHPYDKAVALEAWLRGHPYNLNVQAPPEGRDFIDFFLFDLQGGYCTYYSTAMTVMLRDLGIPSRLVEGFAVPPSAAYTEGTDGKVTYPVLNSQAHAWVEAYFPGYGWVTFDPTPRADLPLIDRSAVPPTADPASTDTTPSSPGNQTDPKPTRDANLQDPGLGGGGGAAAPSAQQRLPWVVAPVLLLAGLLYIGYRRLKDQDQIRASEERQVVQEAWHKTSSLLSLFDFGRKPHQTAREYAQSLSARWPSLQEPAAQVAEDYTVARYAPPDRTPAPGAAARARALWEQVHEAVFNRYGWRTYLWRRLWRRKHSDN
ncbi:MAG: hypothetical protein JWN15_1961 [Firmicutes bacterium]|nr:hypothetical protein [Bacillota bacterium]